MRTRTSTRRRMKSGFSVLAQDTRSPLRVHRQYWLDRMPPICRMGKSRPTRMRGRPRVLGFRFLRSMRKTKVEITKAACGMSPPRIRRLATGEFS